MGGGEVKYRTENDRQIVMGKKGKGEGGEAGGRVKSETQS